MSTRCIGITIAGIVAFASAGSAAREPPRARAHLFADAVHAAAGTCFPKYNLELWKGDVRHELARRNPDSPPRDVPDCNADAMDWNALRAYFRTEHPTSKESAAAWARPKLAISLEGGGSKSAPFALGALAGLHESGLLNDVDIVSSVSGGSYAAYFYFSRLLDAERGGDVFGARNPDAWFRGCTPSVYRSRFTDASITDDQSFCSGPDATRDDIRPFARDFPYQAHIRHFQDVIHWRGGLEEVDRKLSDRLSTWANVGLLFVQSLATSPLHFVGSSLFSGPGNSSPSRLAYRSGIERAYAHSWHSWNGATHCEYPDPAERVAAPTGVDKPLPECKRDPAGGEFSERIHARRYTMRDLAAIIGRDPCAASGVSCRAPLWIVSAAGSSGRDLTNWLSVPSTDAIRANFEMSPFGQGSGLYGFIDTPVAMPLRDVVGASAAFLDRDQREFGLGAKRFFAGVAISALNLEWGSDIPNYNATDAARAVARITPIPLYHVPSARQRYSPMIHLADGGNTDNLGMLAALRRGAENIIVVASTGDGTGQLESLCRVKNHLELDGTYRIWMPELVDLEHVCNRQISAREVAVWGEARVSTLVCYERDSRPFCEERDGRRHWNPDATSALGYDMWDWPIPVLQGVVERDDPDGTVVPIANIYLVKPAMYQEAAKLQVIKDGNPDAHPDRLCALDASYKIDVCSAQVPRQAGGLGVYREFALPCASIAYLIDNACQPGPDNRYGVFPQHDVPFTTLNSSYTLFGAYYDLARHVVAQIGWNDPDAKQWLTVPPSQSDALDIEPKGDRRSTRTGQPSKR